MQISKSLLALALVGAAVTTGFAASSAPMLEPAPLQENSRAYLHSFNLPAHGVAIDGYSPVSYFEGKAERGSALFAVEHDGVSYHLTSAAQVKAFQSSPAKFVPAYGGWCAFGMAVEDKFPVDPTNFAIVDGRLLLFLKNAGVDAKALWEDGSEKDLLKKAGAHWAKVAG